MIVVYDTNTGRIVYTIEGVMGYDENNLRADEAMITSSDESVRCTTHKVVNDRVEHKSEADFALEEQMMAAPESEQATDADIIRRLEDIERRLGQLEGAHPD